ncbi:MAG: PBP1A family penicillin-binding protein [bacterium]|nr:PBP1A family penicillin-binding protein [bacterium]
MILAVSSAAVLLLAIALFGLYLRAGMPSVEQLENFEPQLSTKLLDRNGVVIKEIYQQRRSYVPLSETPVCVTQAFLAIEDHKFYTHWGIRPFALVGAVAKGLAQFELRFRGASTITQQLARNLYYTSQRTIVRKLREALTAIEIERYYSKDEILEMYLTQTYFGAGAYGIGAAAATYFSKSPKDLTIEEAALLAAIPKSPARYNPITCPEAALQRRNIVLWRMWKVHYLTEKRCAELQALPLAVKPSSTDGTLGIAPYFTENVRQQLNVIGRTFGFDPYRDGVTVHTTLDARLQACAERAVQEMLPQVQKSATGVFRSTQLAGVLRKVYPDSSFAAHRRMTNNSRLVDSLALVYMPVQVAFVALDPTNGYILAMIGGRDFEQFKFNRAVQAVRQPGSAFKPFVYATVLDGGTPITTRVSNERLMVPDPTGRNRSDTLVPWPDNFENDYGGVVDLREGLYRSLNVVAARLIREYTTPKDVVALAHRLGITTELDPYDALALGASGVIPLDLCAAYQVFQSGGIWSKPMYITGVDDQFGQPVSVYRPERRAVLSEETAFLTLSLLRSVVDRGTGAALRGRFGFEKPAAGKTGTTNENTDAWFIGFTPYLVAAVWVGLDDPARTLGRGMEGAHAALPIWARFITAAYDSLNYPDADFRVPGGVQSAQICEETDQLASPNCPRIRSEYFNRKFPLPEPCSKHSGARSVRKPRPSLF